MLYFLDMASEVGLCQRETFENLVDIVLVAIGYRYICIAKYEVHAVDETHF